MRSFSMAEVARHASASDCWVVIRGAVYDLSAFIESHPGGKKVILDNAGKDVTAIWESLHDASILKTIAAKFKIGAVENSKVDSTRGQLEPSASPIRKNSTDDFADAEEPFGDLIPYCDPAWYQQLASPFYKNSHVAVRAAVHVFVKKNIVPYVSKWEIDGQIPRSLHLASAAIGIPFSICVSSLRARISSAETSGNENASSGRISALFASLTLPGGVKMQDWDVFHEFVVVDELSRCGSGGALWCLVGGLGIGLPPVIQFGSYELLERVALPVLRGEKTICLAVTEPAAGSDVAAIKTTAAAPEGSNSASVSSTSGSDSGFVVLNGEKKWITNSTFADFMTVACRYGPEKSKKDTKRTVAGSGKSEESSPAAKSLSGLSLFLVERSMPGVEVRPVPTMGMRGSGTGYITFENVKVPLKNLIGAPGVGFKYIVHNFNHERMGMAIQAMRLSRVCFENALRHAIRRKAFGKPLMANPVVRAKLANMATRIETAHAWIESLLFQSSKLTHDMQMLRLGGPIALLKAESSRVFEFCAREAAQILGGRSYTRSGQGETIERLYRDVRAYAIPGGSEEIMQELGIRQSLRVSQFMGARL